jgi:hypothetical protein
MGKLRHLIKAASSDEATCLRTDRKQLFKLGTQAESLSPWFRLLPPYHRAWGSRKLPPFNHCLVWNCPPPTLNFSHSKIGRQFACPSFFFFFFQLWRNSSLFLSMERIPNKGLSQSVLERLTCFTEANTKNSTVKKHFNLLSWRALSM